MYNANSNKIKLTEAQEQFNQALNNNDQDKIKQYLLDDASSLESGAPQPDFNIDVTYQLLTSTETPTDGTYSNVREQAIAFAIPYFLLAISGIECHTGLAIQCFMRYPNLLNDTLPQIELTLLMALVSQEQSIHDQLFNYIIFHPIFDVDSHRLNEASTRKYLRNKLTKYQREQIAQRIAWQTELEWELRDNIPTNYYSISPDKSESVAQSMVASNGVDARLLTQTDLTTTNLTGPSCLTSLCRRLSNEQLDHSLRAHFHQAITFGIKQCIEKNNIVQLKFVLQWLSTYQYAGQIDKADNYSLLQSVISLPQETFLHYYPQGDTNNIYYYLINHPESDFSLCEDRCYLNQLCAKPCNEDEHETSRYHLDTINQYLHLTHYRKAIAGGKTNVIRTLVDNGFDPFSEASSPPFKQAFDLLFRDQYYNTILYLQEIAHSYKNDNQAVNEKLTELIELKTNNEKHYKEAAFKKICIAQVFFLIDKYNNPIVLLEKFSKILDLDTAINALILLIDAQSKEHTASYEKKITADDNSLVEIDISSEHGSTDEDEKHNPISAVLTFINSSWSAQDLLSSHYLLQNFTRLSTDIAESLFSRIDSFYITIKSKLNTNLEQLAKRSAMSGIAHTAYHYFIKEEPKADTDTIESQQEQLLLFATAIAFMASIDPIPIHKPSSSLFSPSKRPKDFFHDFFYQMDILRFNSGLDYWQSNCLANLFVCHLAKLYYPTISVSQTVVLRFLSDHTIDNRETMPEDPRLIVRAPTGELHNITTLINWAGIITNSGGANDNIETIAHATSINAQNFGEIIAQLEEHDIELSISINQVLQKSISDADRYKLIKMLTNYVATPQDSDVARPSMWVRESSIPSGESSPSASISTQSSIDLAPMEGAANQKIFVLDTIKNCTDVFQLKKLRETLIPLRESFFGLTGTTSITRYTAIIHNNKEKVSGSWNSIEKAFINKYLSLIDSCRDSDELDSLKNSLLHPDFQFLRDYGRRESARYYEDINGFQQPVSKNWHKISEALAHKESDLRNALVMG